MVVAVNVAVNVRSFKCLIIDFLYSMRLIVIKWSKVETLPSPSKRHSNQSHYQSLPIIATVECWVWGQCQSMPINDNQCQYQSIHCPSPINHSDQWSDSKLIQIWITCEHLSDHTPMLCSLTLNSLFFDKHLFHAFLSSLCLCLSDVCPNL